MAAGSGIVRVRPTGLSASPARNRYQYQRSGASPCTSTWTECASAGAAVAVPRRTTLRMPSSSATSHRTPTGIGGIPPSGSSGRGASRVHSTTPVGSGSPLATPSANGSAANEAADARVVGPKAAARSASSGTMVSAAA